MWYKLYNILLHPGVFCPRGSAKPVPVQPGFYSLPYNDGVGSNTQFAEAICPM